MLCDTDWDILMKKLGDFEERLNQLQEDINELLPKKPKYTLQELIDMDSPYVLSGGSLVDSGIPQKWRNENVADCISTTTLPKEHLSDYIHKTSEEN